MAQLHFLFIPQVILRSHCDLVIVSVTDWMRNCCWQTSLNIWMHNHCSQNHKVICRSQFHQEIYFEAYSTQFLQAHPQPLFVALHRVMTPNLGIQTHSLPLHRLVWQMAVAMDSCPFHAHLRSSSWFKLFVLYDACETRIQIWLLQFVE